MLSSHFWSDSLKESVSSEAVTFRHRFYRPLLRDLIRHTETELKGRPYYHTTRTALGKVAAGIHPTREEILELAPVFTEKMSLSRLTGRHIR